MEFVPGICPSCNGQLQLPTDRETVKCMYCGSDIRVNQAQSAYAPNRHPPRSGDRVRRHRLLPGRPVLRHPGCRIVPSLRLPRWQPWQFS